MKYIVMMEENGKSNPIIDFNTLEGAIKFLKEKERDPSVMFTFGTPIYNSGPDGVYLILGDIKLYIKEDKDG